LAISSNSGAKLVVLCCSTNSSIRVLLSLNVSRPSKCFVTSNTIKILFSLNILRPCIYILGLAIIALSSDIE